jgi:recombination protein RecT
MPRTSQSSTAAQTRARLQASAAAPAAPATPEPRGHGIEVSVRGMLQRMLPEFQAALPRHVTAERLARVALTEIRRNPRLLDCSIPSLLGAVMLCAQLGLEPGPLGFAYLVPFGGEVTMIPGYRGLLDLAWRSGRLRSFVARVVREGDEFEFDLGTAEQIRHRPPLGQRGRVVGAYGIARFAEGGVLPHVMGVGEIEEHRARSRTPDQGPWVDDYEPMCCKTVVRAMARWMPLSVEFQQAAAQDEFVVQRPMTLDELPGWLEPAAPASAPAPAPAAPATPPPAPAAAAPPPAAPPAKQTSLHDLLRPDQQQKEEKP